MKYGSTLFHLPKRNILISSIISSMVTLLVITMLFMILKVFNLDMMKDHLNQKLVLSVMMMFIWGITFYITHFIKKEMSILRATQ
ncbi:LTA synthase family protein, partial [Bacillus cereus]|nr:LTA synthase family protein [Bacillus cereus]